MTTTLGLSGCEVRNDGHMFQRWAETVRAIPVDDSSASPEPMKLAAADGQPGAAPQRPSLSIQVVDAIDMHEAQNAGLRTVLNIVEAATAKPSPGASAGLRPAIDAAAQVFKTSAHAAAAAPRAVQLAAFASDAAARNAWIALKAAHPAALNGLQARFERADLGAKGVWVRLKVPVTDTAQAQKLCAAVAAQDRWCSGQA